MRYIGNIHRKIKTTSNWTFDRRYKMRILSGLKYDRYKQYHNFFSALLSIYFCMVPTQIHHIFSPNTTWWVREPDDICTFIGEIEKLKVQLFETS